MSVSDLDLNCLQRSAADDKIVAVVGGLVINVYQREKKEI